MNARRAPWLALLLLIGVACLTPSVRATICDTSANRTDFQATVSAWLLNALLSSLGNQAVQPSSSTTLSFDGLCVDHQFDAYAELFTIPLDGTPFEVQPSLGSIRVDLDLLGPFYAGLGTRNYQATNCSDLCIVEIPYVGELFNGCDAEASLVGGVVSGHSAGMSWDDMIVTQTADTCVTTDCEAVHPLVSTNATATGFNVDAFGSCDVCSVFPDELQFLCPSGIFDPCSLLDDLLELPLRPLLENTVEDAFVTNDGKGVLIEVFSNQITKDFACFDIPEVRECKAEMSATAGMVRGPRNPGFNAGLYLLPVVVVIGLAVRLRRKKS